ncbi:DUF4238 domain-containing protein [Actinomadura sp. BRA 177]|uniref:DUF4238 domain-containing protein n=1 Tax=Actinomadura sp. BRA 177 TaxID=2745202 RepID=UPI00159535E2|nr:DUF4238 domain-containing protein [Actinomadura sp. BRA 177]NVI92256.1 DUF4238 domain-containing protein [Actinomadura sp. BRA 177]
MPKSKRHHFVPRAHLARFGKDGRVAVRWRGKSGLIVSGAHNVAVKGGFYETESGTDRASVEFEDRLARLEGLAEKVIRDSISSEQAPDADSEARLILATLMAVQLARTPESRARLLFSRSVLDYAAGREVDFALMAEYLEKIHLGFTPRENEVKGALIYVQELMDRNEVPTKTDAIIISLTGMREPTTALLKKNWSMEIARKPRLITSDAPVVLWRKQDARNTFRGMGIKNAEEIRFPIDAGHQLLLTQVLHSQFLGDGISALPVVADQSAGLVGSAEQ